MEKQKIMVLAGSKWQIPIIKKIKSMGYTVIDVNPYIDSPAFEYADEYMLIDILDKEKCLEAARKEKIVAVMSEQCDIANPTVAYIAEKLNLPTIGLRCAELYTNKMEMRKFCEKMNFANPEYKLCYQLDEALSFFSEVHKKIIIKPLDSNSSRGVFLIEDEIDLQVHFEEALSYSKVTKAVLCERYIEGTEFTVDGIVTKEGHVSLAVSEKKHYMHNPNVACTLFFSHENSRFDYEVLRKLNDNYVNKTGLPFGLTHAEYKYENGKFYLIEIGARGGGNLIGSDIVPLMSGVDNYKYLIEKSLGHDVQIGFNMSDKLEKRCAALQFFDTPGEGGIVKEIQGVDLLENDPMVISYSFNFKVGDMIGKAVNDSERIGYYIAYAESHNELEQKMDEIKNRVKFLIED